MGSWPKDVGILAIEIIFPSRYVDQTELETYDAQTDKDVTPGKYTKGLGQEKMGFCTDREDINSLCLTVVHNLIERNNLKYSDIGRLEVGTETIIDKSKSVKTVLMQLFEPHGVTDLEGIDTTNACYGGTAALFNAISWVESSAWNGRYALVVAGDIAVYASGKARPTGGAGAVAMLIGPDAPLVFERGVRSTYMKHAYDFYKPDLTSEYPTVDGVLSIKCYVEALDKCYQEYCKNATKKTESSSIINLNHFDSVLFHSPFCKLVQKSLARLVLNDYFNLSEEDREKYFSILKVPEGITLENSLKDKDFERQMLAFSKTIFLVKTNPSLLLSSQVGNMYTPSLYGGLVSLLISKDVKQLAGNRIGLFSYGSGLAASFYSIKISDDHNEDSKLFKLVDNLKYVNTLLKQREKVSPEDFVKTLELREKVCHKAPYEPTSDTENFFPGTYYLTKIDEKYRRFYERIPVATNGHA